VTGSPTQEAQRKALGSETLGLQGKKGRCVFYNSKMWPEGYLIITPPPDTVQATEILLFRFIAGRTKHDETKLQHKRFCLARGENLLGFFSSSTEEVHHISHNKWAWRDRWGRFFFYVNSELKYGSHCHKMLMKSSTEHNTKKMSHMER